VFSNVRLLGTQNLSDRTQEDGAKQTIWKRQYHRRWPILSRYLDPDMEVDWKSIFVSRYQQEKYAKGELKVTMNYQNEGVSAIKERIDVFEQQDRFESSFSDGLKTPSLLPDFEDDPAFMSKAQRWRELLLEGTSFSSWSSSMHNEQHHPCTSRAKGSWMLFLPTSLNGLRFHLEGTERPGEVPGTFFDGSVTLEVFEGTSGVLLAQDHVAGDLINIDHKYLLSRLLQVGALPLSVLEGDDDGTENSWKAFPFAFMVYLYNCSDFAFVRTDEESISYTKEELLSGEFN